MRRLPIQPFTRPLTAALFCGALAGVWDLVCLWAYKKYPMWTEVGGRGFLLPYLLLTTAGMLKSLTLACSSVVCFRSAKPLLKSLLYFLKASGLLFMVGIAWSLTFSPSNFEQHARPLFPGPTDMLVIGISIALLKTFIAAGIGATAATLFQCKKRAVGNAALLGMVAGITYSLSDTLFIHYGSARNFAAVGFMALLFSNILTGILPVLAIPRDWHQKLGWGISARIETAIAISETPATLFRLGELYLESKDYVGARMQFEAILQNDAGNIEALYLAAHSCMAARDTAGALQFFERMMAQPDGKKLRFGLAWVEYAECLSANGQGERAFEEFRKLVRHHPRPRTELAYAKYLKRLGKKEQAREVLDDMLATGNDGPKEDQAHLKEGWWMRLFL